MHDDAVFMHAEISACTNKTRVMHAEKNACTTESKFVHEEISACTNFPGRADNMHADFSACIALTRYNFCLSKFAYTSCLSALISIGTMTRKVLPSM